MVSLSIPKAEKNVHLNQFLDQSKWTPPDIFDIIFWNIKEEEDEGESRPLVFCRAVLPRFIKLPKGVLKDIAFVCLYVYKLTLGIY